MDYFIYFFTIFFYPPQPSTLEEDFQPFTLELKLINNIKILIPEVVKIDCKFLSTSLQDVPAPIPLSSYNI